jgi:hypothetical protein
MRIRLALILAMTAIAPGSAGAQSGVWVSAGGGAARNRVSCESCENITHHWGASGFVRVGGVASEHVLVGGELHFWQATIEDQDVYVRGVQAVVLWYPSPPRGFFGQAGLGLSRIRNSFDVGSEVVRGGETGLSVTAGVGWDFPLRKGLYLELCCWLLRSSPVPPRPSVRHPAASLPRLSAAWSTATWAASSTPGVAGEAPSGSSSASTRPGPRSQPKATGSRRATRAPTSTTSSFRSR